MNKLIQIELTPKEFEYMYNLVWHDNKNKELNDMKVKLVMKLSDAKQKSYSGEI